MSLLYMDGFSHYTNLTGAGNRLYELASNLWTFPGGSSSEHASDSNIETMPGLGSDAVRIFWRYQNSGALSSRLNLKLPRSVASGEKWGFGFHAYFNELPAGAARAMLGFGPVPETVICLSSAGTLQYSSGFSFGGSPTGSPAGNLAADTLYHFEIQILFHASAGEVHVRVNGADWLSVTGVDTMPSVDNILAFGPVSSNGSGTDSWLMTNLYIYDDQGSANNDWLGEKFVETLMVNSDGSTQDWALSSGSDAFDLIDNVPPDALTNYIEGATVGDTSVFGVANLADSNVMVSAVQTVIQAYKTGTSDAAIDFGVNSGAGSNVGNTGNLAQDLPQYFYHVSENDPDTSAPWESAAVNSLELVVERET